VGEETISSLNYKKSSTKAKTTLHNFNKILIPILKKDELGINAVSDITNIKLTDKVRNVLSQL
jgi:hypothetical protein